ncbi:bifunctional [glutamate--ammonia ligase]-adenylyl-L-tyrosine phosphorylase/[glutamate--ammonia-ligase] adenylyltransferase [Aurantiacibacter poecillastricola]|uniref:bifunctional [glutamate--ammonia ligase]-adenylyl-L-tyrosine phosphorylase/[glutamate--ammonia-ligase] adenylyltransferase n=1 Tax=Aurantiacibacter poecillastricola TaxID=3064385 RepID=UPI00273D4A6E|nr:bifunctional [glutamate--ammonia ligase]-adenylyl-L-tyrosine phosphorylase/[glutamate--ammonia-ligase] adenylyltransferase [Aurantiacibacter sp. 219JJ12-13]MDP5260682.1 bifunctional [glutamate--ammonia ligase]-adenylyl-L-tyrosine phosphorylase/[glutamate--ammonia-ligase] adenylyltransferase [Aurantiacibacter sp. 219JJ12-13]
MTADWPSALTRARDHSPFLKRAMDNRPELVSLLADGKGKQALAQAKAAGEGQDDTGLALRRERLSLALVLAIGDLAGAFDLPLVMSELSSFADRALDAAMLAVVRKRVEGADTSGFTALALGKQGAGELNYSSDIDPILLFDPDRIARRDRDEPGEAAQRYARQLVEMLGQPTGEGYVLRVDLRLRPASEVTPLAIPFLAAIQHYESSALAWERAAFIRARSAAGDIAAGEDFLDEIRSFIWRRSLDFTAIEEVRRLTRRIREAYKGTREVGPGFDIKRGRGGIREIEFYAQTHQLIYGGRNPALRLRGTRAALDALAEADIIAAEDAQVLGESYDRLRVIEHRLQMVNDRQTHALPDTADKIDNVARLGGHADGAALIAELRDICARVAERYDDLLGEDDDAGSTAISVPAAFRERFETRVEHWHNTLRALRSAEARKAFEAIEATLLESLSAAPDPDHALARWETLLERLPSAINLFRLFEQRPGLLDRVLRILTLARPLADELARRVELLDALIDPNALDLPGSIETLAARMEAAEDTDYESRLDRLRQVVGDERFALGAQMVECRHDPLEIAEGLCRVAEAAVRTGADAAIADFQAKHGRIPGSELVILGVGRLGGGALTHASDLDVIFLFTDPGEIGVESDGERPLSTALYYNRLAARVTAALSVPTAEGALYEIDTRLRPSGKQGPLAVGFAAFERYQRESAWTWEHMALARARPIYGSGEACESLSATIRDVLYAPRDPDTLRKDVLHMRGEMLKAKPPQGPLDVKLMRGGLVDSEFLVHYLQLRDGVGMYPAVDQAIATMSEAGLLPPDYARAHLDITRYLVAVRLFAPDANEPVKATRAVLAQACGEDSYKALLQSLATARQTIAAQWARHLGETLETD